MNLLPVKPSVPYETSSEYVETYSTFFLDEPTARESLYPLRDQFRVRENLLYFLF